MANLNDVTIRRNNMVIVELVKEERVDILDEIRREEGMNVPVVVTLSGNNEEDFFGDVRIIGTDDEETGKTLYNANVVAISPDGSYVSSQAVRIGIKEILNKFKSEKVNIDCIYLVQEEAIPSLAMIEIGLGVQEILVDYKLTDKVRLWVENLEESIEEDYTVADKGFKESTKNFKESTKKKKDKKNKDKKKKKKGKKK